MTHTKGPWSTRFIKAYGHIVEDQYGNKLADAMAINSGESILNARLIAAAPELLAFIQKHFLPGKVGFATILELYHDTNACEAPECCGHCLMVKEARELLNKAEGK
jgi:hypothetical protein